MICGELYMREALLSDLAYLAPRLEVAEVEQYTEFTGRDYMPQRVAAELYLLDGPRWTIARGADDSPVAAGGFERIRPHVYRSWFLSTPATWAYGQEVTQICRQTILNMLDGAQRLETVSLSNRAKAHRWYERIGLTREAEHPGYGVTGQAAVTYVRVR